MILKGYQTNENTPAIEYHSYNDDFKVRSLPLKSSYGGFQK